MSTETKSGAALVSDFFTSLDGRNDLDAKVVKALCDLHSQGKLTPVQIGNALEAARNEAMNDKATGT